MMDPNHSTPIETEVNMERSYAEKSLSSKAESRAHSPMESQVMDVQPMDSQTFESPTMKDSSSQNLSTLSKMIKGKYFIPVLKASKNHFSKTIFERKISPCTTSLNLEEVASTHAVSTFY